MTRPPSACALSLAAAARITWARTQRGWNQAALAREAGLSSAAVSLLESGQRNLTLPILERLAAALRMPPQVFLAGPVECRACGGKPAPRTMCLDCGTATP